VHIKSLHIIIIVVVVVVVIMKVIQCHLNQFVLIFQNIRQVPPHVSLHEGSVSRV